jgi:hypothetical protein
MHLRESLSTICNLDFEITTLIIEIVTALSEISSVNSEFFDGFFETWSFKFRSFRRKLLKNIDLCVYKAALGGEPRLRGNIRLVTASDPLHFASRMILA